ncbi:MAG: LysR family transcriptional regulator [Pseudomonadota bacterium]
MEIRQLEYFVASVEEKSFYKASTKLFISQPAISKAIASLENELQASLFIRSSRGLRLTDRGERLYHEAKNILHQISIIKDEGYNRNECLRLSSYPSRLIAKDLTNFYNKYRDTLEIDYREGTVQNIIQNVNSGISEFGILYISPNQEKTLSHILSHNNLEFIPILENELCIYMGEKHEKYGHEETVTIDALSEYKYIRGLKDFFSVEHHFDYVNLNEINTSKFQDVVVTNSDHLVTEMLANTDLCYLGINITNHVVKSKNYIDSEKKRLILGYIKNKTANLSRVAEEFLHMAGKYV